MTKSEKSAKSWVSDIAPIGLAVLLVAAAALGFRLLYANDKAVSQETMLDAQREAFLKQHYPVDLGSAKEPARSAAPPPATSR